MTETWTATTTAITSDIWPVWVTSTASTTTAGAWHSWIVAEEWECGHEARTLAFREQVERNEKRRKEAVRCAEDLLKSYLDSRQREDLEKNGWFLVDGKSGARYRIRKGPSMTGNVELLNVDGSVRVRLCAHDRQNGTPVPDQLLTQKFYLEHHEEEFLRIANRS
jgi:hypothetical protein